MANVLAHQIVTAHRHHVVAPDISKLVQHLRHTLRHRGFAGAGVAGEAHMQGRGLRLQPHFPPGTLHQQ